MAFEQKITCTKRRRWRRRCLFFCCWARIYSLIMIQDNSVFIRETHLNYWYSSVERKKYDFLYGIHTPFNLRDCCTACIHIIGRETLHFIRWWGFGRRKKRVCMHNNSCLILVSTTRTTTFLEVTPLRNDVSAKWWHQFVRHYCDDKCIMYLETNRSSFI